MYTTTVTDYSTSVSVVNLSCFLSLGAGYVQDLPFPTACCGAQGLKITEACCIPAARSFARAMLRKSPETHAREAAQADGRASRRPGPFLPLLPRLGLNCPELASPDSPQLSKAQAQLTKRKHHYISARASSPAGLVLFVCVVPLPGSKCSAPPLCARAFAPRNPKCPFEILTPFLGGWGTPNHGHPFGLLRLESGSFL